MPEEIVQSDEKKPEVITQPENKEAPKERVIPKEAGDLWDLLNNPNTSKLTIEALAQKAGLKLTKAEAKELKSEIDEIKEELGEDFDALPPKLIPTVKKMISRAINEVREEQNAREAKQIERKTEEAFTQLKREYKDAADLQDDIIALSHTITPGTDQEPYEYIENLYLIAAGRRNKNADQRRKERAKENKKEVTMTSELGDEHVTKRVATKRSLDEIVRDTADKLARENKE